jgi:hypothetical protein
MPSFAVPSHVVEGDSLAKQREARNKSDEGGKTLYIYIYIYNGLGTAFEDQFVPS